MTLIFGFSYTLIQAQNPGPPPMPNPDELLKRMEIVLKPKLNASPEQWKGLEKVLRDFITKTDKLRKDNPPPPPKPEVEIQMQKYEAERNLNIQKILNEKQYSEFQKLENQLKPPRPQGPPGNGKPIHDPRPENGEPK